MTLSDEEARRRRSQKSVLERKAPPTFQVLVEIKGWHHMMVHMDVAETIDSLLRGRSIAVEERVRGDSNGIETTKHAIAPPKELRAQELWDPQVGEVRERYERPGSHDNGRSRVAKSQFTPDHWSEEAREKGPTRDPSFHFSFWRKSQALGGCGKALGRAGMGKRRP